MAREMKDSGNIRIGFIPDGWSIKKLKYVCSLYTGNSIKDEEKELYEDPTDAVPYLSSKDIDATFYTADYKNGMYVKKDDQSFKIAPSGSTLMCIEGGSAGRKKTKLIHKVAFVNKLCCFNPTEIDGTYLYYWLCSPNFEDEFRQNITGLIGGVSVSVLQNLFITFPPLTEQYRIASFLDSECARIDSVIEQTRESIEEYKKLKQSVITQAVTKGIRGDRPMKDSGIEWIGEIPEEWNCVKTLWVLSMPITDGPHTTPELFDSGVAFVSAEAVSCGNGRIDFSHIRGYISEEFYQECCLKYIPEINDIYMIKSGATTGRVSIVDSLEPKFTIWSPLAVFRCDKSIILPKYMFYELQSNSFQKQIEFGWSFGTQQNIGMRVLEQLKVTVPQLQEQQEIANYIDEKCTKIDKLIETKQKLITELESYKKSLIYEYVTGKKEVPECR